MKTKSDVMRDICKRYADKKGIIFLDETNCCDIKTTKQCWKIDIRLSDFENNIKGLPEFQPTPSWWIRLMNKLKGGKNRNGN